MLLTLCKSLQSGKPLLSSVFTSLSTTGANFHPSLDFMALQGISPDFCTTDFPLVPLSCATAATCCGVGISGNADRNGDVASWADIWRAGVARKMGTVDWGGVAEDALLRLPCDISTPILTDNVYTDPKQLDAVGAPTALQLPPSETRKEAQVEKANGPTIQHQFRISACLKTQARMLVPDSGNRSIFVAIADNSDGLSDVVDMNDEPLVSSCQDTTKRR